MGVLIRGIPYKSQYDPDASQFRNDCGPACVAMILNALGYNVTTNTVYHKTGAGSNEYVSVSQLMRAGHAYQVTFNYFYPWTMDDIKAAVLAGKAVIPLVHYGDWVKLGKTQSTFPGPHFVVVLGFNNQEMIVNDPLWWGTRRLEGQRKRWTFAEFEAAWKGATKDGNRGYSGIYCTHTLQVVSIGATGPALPPAPPPPEPPPPEPPPVVFTIDPLLERRIMAWAAYYGQPEPQLTSQAAVTSYTDAMDEWGLRVEVHTVTLNDTLPLMALHYYNDPEKWDVIVVFNGLAFSDPIHDGDALLIPEPLVQPVIIPPNEIPTGGTPYHKSGDDEPRAQ